MKRILGFLMAFTMAITVFNGITVSAAENSDFTAPVLSFENDTLTLDKNSAESVKVGVAFIGSLTFEVGVDDWNEFVEKGKRFNEMNGSAGYVLYNNTFEGKTYKTKGNYVAFTKYTNDLGETVADYYTFRVIAEPYAWFTFDNTTNKLNVALNGIENYKIGVSYHGLTDFDTSDYWNSFVENGKKYPEFNGPAGYVMYDNACPDKVFKTRGNYVAFIKYTDIRGNTSTKYLFFEVVPALSFDSTKNALSLKTSYYYYAKVGVAYIGDETFTTGKDGWDEFVEKGQKYEELNGEKGYVLYPITGSMAYVETHNIKTYRTPGNYVAFVKCQQRYGDGTYTSNYYTFTVE